MSNALLTSVSLPALVTSGAGVSTTLTNGVLQTRLRYDNLGSTTPVDTDVVAFLRPGTGIYHQTTMAGVASASGLTQGATPFSVVWTSIPSRNLGLFPVGAIMQTVGHTNFADGGDCLIQKMFGPPGIVTARHIQSSDGSWFMIIGSRVKPQSLGIFPNSLAFDLVTAYVLAEQAGFSELFLSNDDWYSTGYVLPFNVRVTGPGSSRITVNLTEKSWGDNRETYSRWNNRSRVIRGRNDANTEARFAPSTMLLRTTAQSIGTGSDTALFFDTSDDGAGVFRPTISISGIWPHPGTRKTKISGFVTFAANATGTRRVSLYRGGVLVANRVVRAPNNGASEPVTIHFTFIESILLDGTSAYDIRVFQDSGASLNVTFAQVEVELQTRDPSAFPGKRIKIFQQKWEDEESKYASYSAFVNALAAYDVVCLSHIEAFGAAPYPLLPKPNGIQDSGYKKLRRLIRDLKTINPDILVFGYVSAAIDAPNWDANGNPTARLTNAVAGNYDNFFFVCDLWLQDQSIELDGFFLDHFETTFIDETVRNRVIEIVRFYGMKAMVNITAVGTSGSTVNWALDCPHLTFGDYLCIEGFWVDGGVTNAGLQTESANALTAAHRAYSRGINLAVIAEEGRAVSWRNVAEGNTAAWSATAPAHRAYDLQTKQWFVCAVGHASPASGTFAAYRAANPTHWTPVAGPVINGSTNDVDAQALFNTHYRPGWLYGYDNVSYGHIGIPPL